MATATEAKLRILLGDPDDGDTELSTAQYTSIIADESDLYRAAALAARSIAAKYANKTDVKAEGGTSADLSQKFDHWIKLADQYDFRAVEGGSDLASPVVGGVSVTTTEAVDVLTDRVKPKFSVGQFDNPGTESELVREWDED